MLIKIFGVADLLAAASLVLLSWGFKGWVAFLALASAVYLALKGLLFFFNYASILDIASAAVIVLVLAGFKSVVSYFFVFWLVQKGVRSLM